MAENEESSPSSKKLASQNSSNPDSFQHIEDQFNGQDFENTSNRDLSEYNFSMFQDAFEQDGNDINCDFNNVFQPPLKFEDQIFVNGLDEFISWEFNINRDMMYI
ncbi:hypothetical protein HAX54_012266 [Datura stramonium]|uniref:Uncharacterized protein n=1 Tax=Datura stramonium TaxID=4076 RepID=A0ABS8TJH6_DATST|nr:hypothetical protein [Datura stramonium]